MEPIVTWNLFLTAVAIPALGFYLKRVYDRADQVNELRFKQITDSLDMYCKKNERGHDEIWERLHHHGHACCSDKDTRIVVNDR